MGLDCSHDAFHGAYSSFNRLRGAVARAAGGSFPPHDDPALNPRDWYWEGDDYSHETHPGLSAFLMHSDCDGLIEPDLCARVADDLEALIPKIEDPTGGGGHLERFGGYAGALQLFVDGCRKAHAAGEPLTFH